MNAPHSSLLIALQERIAQEVPEIRWTDQDFGQLEAYGDRPAVDWPCLLIDMGSTTFEDWADRRQEATTTLSLRLGFTTFSHSSGITPTDYRAKALEYYEIEWKIFKALHGWKAAGYGYLNRISAATEKRDDTIRVRQLSLSITFEDYFAQPEPTYTRLGDLEITS